MQAFTKQAIDIIASIPAGTVMTYGQVAALAGSPRGARQVVRILHSMSKKHRLPWHRVISAKGEIAVREDESFFLQKELLRAEGVDVSDEGVIDLERYRYVPTG